MNGELDLERLDTYFTIGYIPAPHTIFQPIKKLEAGHSPLVHQGELRKERYWSHRLRPQLDITFAEAQEELLSRLRKAVSVRMVSDVPLGCFLSGGVDSSVAIALMAEQCSQPIRTFFIGFPETDFSELVHACTVARHLGTNPTLVQRVCIRTASSPIWSAHSSLAEIPTSRRR